MSIKISPEQLAPLARRVLAARWPKASWQMKGDTDAQKVMAFEKLGYGSMATDFPMLQGEWVVVGTHEIKISYPKWDIPGYVYVRRHIGYRKGEHYRELEGV